MSILDFVMVGSNDYKKSSELYDAAFEPLKLKKILTTEKYIGYAHLSDPEKVIFYITNPVNGKPATIGNGSQITLLAESKEAVEKFYEIAISKGATDEGAPLNKPEQPWQIWLQIIFKNFLNQAIVKIR